jgi:hypothetical protein
MTLEFFGGSMDEDLYCAFERMLHGPPEGHQPPFQSMDSMSVKCLGMETPSTAIIKKEKKCKI